MKNKIIVTNIPSFYKINLYNEVNRGVKLLVIFTDANDSDRNSDFVNGIMEFDHIFLSGGTLTKVKQAISIVYHRDYDELILGGWDHPVLWTLAFCFPKRKNSFFIESCYLESFTTGLKGYIKKVFVSRLFRVYASGKSQRKITDDLGFRGETIITKGVGVFNYIPQPAYTSKEKVQNFLYVGRFVEVKNLKFLISIFNELPQYNLYLAGFGEQEEELRAMAMENVHFLGAIDNKELSSYYQKMDVFVLPSMSEPWGLVVEEALNNGIPVIVSDRVGCADEIINDSNGIVFKFDEAQALKEAIAKMTYIDYYNSLRKNISNMDFEKIEHRQIECYLS